MLCKSIGIVTMPACIIGAWLEERVAPALDRGRCNSELQVWTDAVFRYVSSVQMSKREQGERTPCSTDSTRS